MRFLPELLSRYPKEQTRTCVVKQSISFNFCEYSELTAEMQLFYRYGHKKRVSLLHRTATTRSWSCRTYPVQRYDIFPNRQNRGANLLKNSLKARRERDMSEFICRSDESGVSDISATRRTSAVAVYRFPRIEAIVAYSVAGKENPSVDLYIDSSSS